MAVVTGQALVLKGTNGLSILLGSGPPDSTVGVDGQPGYLDTTNNLLYGPRVAGSWPSVGYQFGGNLLMYAGRPPDSFGAIGNLSLDISQGFIYGPRTATAWPAQPLLALVGPQGAKGDTGPAATVPPDLTLNSLILSPVAGNSNAVQIAIKNSAGAILWGVDTNGNQVVGGTLNVTGKTTLNGPLAAGPVTASTVDASGNATVAGTLNVTGTTTLGTTKVANVTFNDGTVQTTATAASAGSATASRTMLDMGSFYNTGVNAGSLYGIYRAVPNATNPASYSSAAFYDQLLKLPYSFTITGYAVINAANTSFNLLYYKNGSSIGQFSVPATAGAYSGTHAKGTYSFAANDSFRIVVQPGASTANFQVYAIIEWT